MENHWIVELSIRVKYRKESTEVETYLSWESPTSPLPSTSNNWSPAWSRPSCQTKQQPIENG